MIRRIWLLALLVAVSACNNKREKETITARKATTSGPANRVVGIGKIEPESQIILLSPAVNGIVKQILKKENDSVNAGTPIVELEHELEDGKVKQLAAEVRTQINQIKADEASVSEYQAKYNNAVTAVQRLQRLLSSGAETQQTVDDATTNVVALQANLKRLQASVAVAKSRLEETKASLHVANIQKDQKTIKSPVDGLILDITALTGSQVDTREPVAQIRPVGKTIAVCEIDELYADRILPGQKAWIRNVGAQDTLSAGTVYLALSFLQKKSLFTDQPGEKEDRRVRTIKIMIDQPEKLLLNARVECIIDISGNTK